jgi:hypothetical protein
MLAGSSLFNGRPFFGFDRWPNPIPKDTSLVLNQIKKTMSSSDETDAYDDIPSNHELSERMARIEAEIEHISKAVDRIEGNMKENQDEVVLKVDENTEKVDAIDANVLSDDHFHDGMTVAVEDGEIIPLERESAERERYVKQKIERMGKRMDDIEDE